MNNNNNNQNQNQMKNQNQIENEMKNLNQNQNQIENEMKNLEKKVTKNLIEDYSNLLNINLFKDFSIFVDNESNPFEFKVHKSILSSRSSFFNKFLREENHRDKIFLNQFNKKEMESILSYIYYGNVSFENQENLFELLEISIHFKLNLLKEIIQKKISNSINYSNFFQFFFQNRDLKLNEIEIKCFELINQNFSQIKKNENLFNLTEEEIIKFIQFKQEKKEIFEFDFFQFLSKWIKKRNEKLKGKKEQEKEKGIEKKRLSHSFFSLIEKDSISKQDFDKLKEFDFFPNSFLVNLERTSSQIQEQENEKIKKENKTFKNTIKRRDKKIKLKKNEIEDKKKEIKKKNQEIKKKNKEIQSKNKIIQSKDEIIQSKDEIIKNLESQIIKNKAKEKTLKELHDKLKEIFKNSEIIEEVEYMKKLKKWINDNDFFSKMKKGFSAKKDGFSSTKWHETVDGKGKTLVIIKTTDNYIFGGFTQIGFKSNQSVNLAKIRDPNAFIFSLRKDDDDRIPEKFTIKKGKEDFAIFSNSTFGPSFGEWFRNVYPDFYLSSDFRSGYSNFGHSYNLPIEIEYGSNQAKSYLAGSPDKWVIDELETYFI